MPGVDTALFRAVVMSPLAGTSVSAYELRPRVVAADSTVVTAGVSAAAIVAVMLDPDKAPALAYIGGTLGVLLGADILRLKDIGKLGEPVASIGGAGTFDGIFVTGIVAVLLT